MAGLGDDRDRAIVAEVALVFGAQQVGDGVDGVALHADRRGVDAVRHQPRPHQVGFRHAKEGLAGRVGAAPRGALAVDG
ncbi:hypothetical protein GCM10010109_48500 [Actinoplanes campanulatus]|nr:hypothetical protein GCM10010109_48500 [Actinoplanes campanulatus]GID38874.1 hypothetical protein Aca09nite_53800 [Actinoplanes campanulatus]